MNTDGLGTPLEPSNTTTSESYNRAGIRGIFSAEQDDPERVEEPLQMTQLGYEDPDVAAWRERVDAKMGGGKAKGSGKAGTTPGKGRKEDASLGIAKRTRLATGR